VGEVIVKTKKPLAIKDFNDVQELGRFVLVHDENICAGGIITVAN
jgi:translation elongation factor EF-1alpha